jgi:hypothetical protein
LLPPIKLNLLLLQYLVEAKDVLTASSESLYLVRVLLPSNLDLGLVCIKGGADLDDGFLRDPCLLHPRSEGFLPPREFPLPHMEPLNRRS